jgi:hypothetical protein
MQSLFSAERCCQADLCLPDTRLGDLPRTAHDRTVAGLENPTRSPNGSLLLVDIEVEPSARKRPLKQRF